MRYASANIKLDGYEPCGNLDAQVTCDPIGKKFISTSREVPYSYRDCAVGQRLVVERHEEPLSTKTAQDSLLESAEHNPAPMSPAEKKEMKKALDDISRRKGDVFMEVYKAMLSRSGRQPDPASPPGESREQVLQLIEDTLQGLGPEGREYIEQFLDLSAAL